MSRDSAVIEVVGEEVGNPPVLPYRQFPTHPRVAVTLQNLQVTSSVETSGSSGVFPCKLLDTNSQLKGAEDFDIDLVAFMVDQIAKDTSFDADFSASTQHNFHKWIVTALGERAIKGLLAQIDRYPWICIFLLQEITGEAPYSRPGLKLAELVEAWKKWARNQARRRP